MDNSVQNSAEGLKEHFLEDIELPVKPEMDWFLFMQDAGLLLAVVILLLLVYVILRYGRWFNHALLFSPLSLRWRLFQIRRVASELADEPLSEQGLQSFYLWTLRFDSVFKQTSAKHLNNDLQELAREIQQLKYQVEFLMFSNSPVSRETYLTTLNKAQVLLNKTLSFGFICKCLFCSLSGRGRA